MSPCLATRAVRHADKRRPLQNPNLTSKWYWSTPQKLCLSASYSQPVIVMLITENQPDRIQRLEQRMFEYYNRNTDYSPYVKESRCVELWEQVLVEARRICDRQGKCRVLEIGSGRSGFGRYISNEWKRDRTQVHYTAQDVSPANKEWLKTQADDVIIDNPLSIQGQFDVIFHSFVLEHIAQPRTFLEHAFSLLSAGGSHVFSCPNFSLPFYGPPSIRHFNPMRRLEFHMMNAKRLLFRQPKFPLIEEPAIFSLPFKRDRDAIHCVSPHDITSLFADRAHFRRFTVQGHSAKDRFIKRFATIHLVMQKLPPVDTRTID